MDWLTCEVCGKNVAPTTAPAGARDAAFRTHDKDHEQGRNLERLNAMIGSMLEPQSRKIRSITSPRQDRPRRFDPSM